MTLALLRVACWLLFHIDWLRTTIPHLRPAPFRACACLPACRPGGGCWLST